MFERLLIATGNRGKLAEIRELLSDVEVLPQSGFNVESAEETGLTFVENAILKARHAARATGLPALADDSGLEVEALNGAPGIYSARYAGPAANDRANVEKLLNALSDRPDAERGARFRCVLALMRHGDDPSPLIFEGSWDGRVATQPAGDNGFGYDPVFFVPELGKTAAQLAPEEKNRLSHRGQALAALRGFLTPSPSGRRLG
ncbi:MAG TPA: XTP/dITP diphosphatase [Gammaproteobacteria bacterium]|nr:XTP/dITP diphosphatase [Gammaproteobacteria bacterium]